MNAAIKIDYIDKKTKYEFHYPIDIFKKPTNEKEYNRLEKILDELIDEVRDNEKHPLATVMYIIGNNLELYYDEHYPEIGSDVSNIEMVNYLMESNNLKQKDLA